MKGRQVQLRCGDEVLDLNSAQYVLLAAGGWTSSGEALEITLHVPAAALVDLDRAITPLRRMLTAAEAYEQEGVGTRVEVWTKTCDDLGPIAELGATWLVKGVTGGSVLVAPVTGLAAVPSAQVTVSLEVDALWRRAAPAAVLEVGATTDVTPGDGRLTVAAGRALTVARLGTLAGGFTVRVRWLFADSDCVFFMAEAGTNDVKAWYQASDHKLYMQDAAGTQASSSALTGTAAGAELDLVFKWDIVTPKMGIWLNGAAGGSAAGCGLDFGGTGSELLTNGGFESFTGTADNGASDTFTGWLNAQVNDGAGDRVEASSTRYAGGYGLKLSSGTGTPYVQQYCTVQPNVAYRLSVFARGDGARNGMLEVYQTAPVIAQLLAAPASSATTFSEVAAVLVMPPGCTQIAVICSGPRTAGTAWFDAASLKRLAEPETYQVFAPGSIGQTLLSHQVWPVALTDGACAGLAAWGRPELELPYCVLPADSSNAKARYDLWSVPGDAAGRLRVLVRALALSTDEEAQVLVGLRPRRVAGTTVFECESGTLGPRTTVRSGDWWYSGAAAARYTATDDAWTNCVTVTLATGTELARLAGEHRVLVGCYDLAYTAGTNVCRYRLVTAGSAGSWSEAFGPAEHHRAQLLDLGTVRIPDGQWPEGTLAAGATVTLELEARSTVGANNPIDFDVVLLLPAEREGRAAYETQLHPVAGLLDFTGPQPAFAAVTDGRSMQFAAWADYAGDLLELLPSVGAGGTLVVKLLAAAQQATMAAGVDVQLLYEPRWER